MAKRKRARNPKAQDHPQEAGVGGKATLEEIQERLSRRGPIDVGVDIAQLIREDRDAH